MADPVTLAGIGLASSALGSGVSAYGALQSGGAQSSAYQYQASLAKMNEQVAKQNAAYETATGEVQAQQSGIKTQFQIGQTRTAQAAGNIDVNTGTAKAVQTSEREVGEEDQALIRSNAARRAYGYEVEGANQEAQSNIYSKAASNTEQGSWLTAASTILGGAASVSSKWSQASTQGIFS